MYVYVMVVSQARPFPFHRANHFQYSCQYWKQSVLWNEKGLACETNVRAARGSRIYLAHWSICDWNRKSWLAKITLDRLIVSSNSLDCLIIPPDVLIAWSTVVQRSLVWPLLCRSGGSVLDARSLCNPEKPESSVATISRPCQGVKLFLADSPLTGWSQLLGNFKMHSAWNMNSNTLQTFLCWPCNGARIT